MPDNAASATSSPEPRAPAAPVSAMPRKRLISGGTDIAATLAVIVVIVVAMQIASSYVPDYIMPSPANVLRATGELLFADKLQVMVTLARLAAAVLFSLIVGVVLGALMGTIGVIRPFLRAVIVIDTGIPALSWMLVAVFWFKDPEIRIFFILTVILLPFFALSIYDGIRALPRDFLDMVESFRPSRGQILRYLVIPHVVPYVFLTVKSVIGYAIRMVVFAELVASATGIGSRMSLAQSTFRIDLVFAWTFLLVLLNLGLQAGVAALEKSVLRWRPEIEVR